MTIHKRTAAAFLALAAAATFATSQAHATIVYQDGDLILGFRATGGTGASTDYLVDLGSASSIVNSQVPIVFNIGAILLDLNNLYTPGWTSRGDVLWSVSGVQKIGSPDFATNTMFATRSDTIDGPLGTNTTTPWTRPSSFAAGTPAGKIQAMGQKYGVGTTGAVSGTDQIESTNAPGALIQPISQTNSFASFMPFGINVGGTSAAYSYFNDANGIEGTFANGTTASVLDLYQLTPGAGSLPATFVGNVTINDGGVVAYTPAGFVAPEPSTAISLIVGAGLLGSIRRRRSTSASV